MTEKGRFGMKFLFASDSFKGTLTSEQTIALLKKAAGEIFPGCETGGVPVADGGEGTTEAVVKARQGRLVPVKVQGPLGEETEAFYGMLSEQEAILEMAAASGLPLLPRSAAIRASRRAMAQESWCMQCSRQAFAISALRLAVLRRMTVAWALRVRWECVFWIGRDMNSWAGARIWRRLRILM